MAHDYLDARGIAYERLTFSAETPKGAANVARTLGYQDRQMVKTLIFRSGKGEHVLVMLGGDQSAVSGLLKKAIGNRNIRMANPDDITELTGGYVIGSIPAFGWQPDRFRTFIEKSLLDCDILGVGAGVWGNEIMITPQNLIAATNAIVVNLTDRNQPVYK